MSHWIKTTRLTGELISLRPLQATDKKQILEATADGELAQLWYTGVPDKSTIDSYIETALNNQQRLGEHPFVVILNSTGKVIGCTRYCHVDNENHRLEIGYTWYAQSFQRSGVNTETKLLLLQNAFENLQAIAVEFRTHWFNHTSRNAILRLGAKQDGVLRNHKRLSDGSYRDTVVFSIIESEWGAVKKHLQFKLNQHKLNQHTK